MNLVKPDSTKYKEIEAKKLTHDQITDDIHYNPLDIAVRLLLGSLLGIGRQILSLEGPTI